MTSPWYAQIPIATARLTLRDLDPADAPRIVRYVGDIKVARMLAAVPLPYGPADALDFITGMREANAGGQGLGLAISETRDPDALIGVISFTGTVAAAEIGWWLGRPYWGRGFATEAAGALVRAAFREPRLQRLTAGAFFDNPASLHVQDKVGFARTGESQRHNLARDGLVRHIDTEITRAMFLAMPPGR
ncbi:MAG: GNAT family N-acetyltransferase [Rhizobiales bacterium]|nr:GNAT family N-acetyltransferase [Hyphomicrobiales bacterium]